VLHTIGGPPASAGRLSTSTTGTVGSGRPPGAGSSLLTGALAPGRGPSEPTATGGALGYFAGLAAVIGGSPLVPAWLQLSSGLSPAPYSSAPGHDRGSPASSGAIPAGAPPGGLAVPGSAAASSGFGFSIFLMLAGLLVLGALLASGRLRLSSELWLPAPFVSLLARPG